MKTRKNENKTRRSLPLCDFSHPVTVRYYNSRYNVDMYETTTDIYRLTWLLRIYGDFAKIVASGNN